MINRWMTLLVDELHDDGISGPLQQSFMLAAVWDDLCRIAGEAPPAGVRALLEDAAGRIRPIAGTTPPGGTGRPGPRRQGNGATVNSAFAALLADLEAGDVPAPLSQPFTLGLLWADLCRLTSEAPPAAILALLDGAAPSVPHPRPLETCRVRQIVPASAAVIDEARE